MTRQEVRAANMVWGEGIADDAWAETAAVTRWGDVHPDEYIRLFPALARHPAPLHPALRDHLAEAVAVHAWRLPGRAGIAPLDQVAGAVTVGAARQAAWFAAPALWRVWLGWFGIGGAPGPVSADAAVAFQLGALLDGLREDRPPPFTEGLALTVAFHAALHPAYLWPEALAMADCAAAVGWLGMLARGRPALMPLDVALLIRDGVDLRAPRVGRLRDARLALCGFGGAQWAALADAATLRLAGRRVPVRLGAAPRPRPLRTAVVDAAPVPARAAQR